MGRDEGVAKSDIASSRRMWFLEIFNAGSGYLDAVQYLLNLITCTPINQLNMNNANLSRITATADM